MARNERATRADECLEGNSGHDADGPLCRLMTLSGPGRVEMIAPYGVTTTLIAALSGADIVACSYVPQQITRQGQVRNQSGASAVPIDGRLDADHPDQARHRSAHAEKVW